MKKIVLVLILLSMLFSVGYKSGGIKVMKLCADGDTGLATVKISSDFGGVVKLVNIHTQRAYKYDFAAHPGMALITSLKPGTYDIFYNNVRIGRAWLTPDNLCVIDNLP